MNVHNFVQAGEDGDRKRLQKYIDGGGDVNAVDSVLDFLFCQKLI